MEVKNFRHKRVMQDYGVCEHCIYENDSDCYYKSCEEGIEKYEKALQEKNKDKS